MKQLSAASADGRAAFGELRATCHSLEGELGEVIQDFGLSDTQFAALSAIRQAGKGGLACGEIGDAIPTRLPDITRLVDRLAAAGLIERFHCHDDRRVVRIALSKHGSKLLQKMDAPVGAIFKRQFADLSARQITDLVRLLRKLRP